MTSTPDGTTGVRFGYSGWSYYWTTAIVVMTGLVVPLVGLDAARSATLVGEVVAVTADWLGTPIIAVKAFPSADTPVRRYLGRFGSGKLSFWPIVVIRTSWLASDPTIVYHALSFYHAHSELRSELATPQALRRID